MVGVLRPSTRQRDTAKWLKYGTLAVSESSLPTSKSMFSEDENYENGTFLPYSRSISSSYVSYTCTSEGSSKMHDLNANEEDCSCACDVMQSRPGSKITGEISCDQIKDIAEEFRLTENDVRDALWEYVIRKRCFPKRPVIEMEILRIDCICVYRYILETCIEQPQTRWVTEPYDGNDVPLPVLPINGRDSTSTFSGHQKMTSATIKICQPCSGRGVKPCVHCICTGRARCPFCQNHNFHHDGVGHLHSSRCLHCSGFSYLPCPYCKGIGHTPCLKCAGKGKLKSYMQVKMAEKHVITDLITSATNECAQNELPLPTSVLKNSKADLIFEDQCKNSVLQPITFTTMIERISTRFLKQHELAYPSGKVKMQKHKLMAIPMTKVDAEYRKVLRSFFIYGKQKSIWFPNYFTTWSSLCCFRGCKLM